jgi:hypothetical protein
MSTDATTSTSLLLHVLHNQWELWAKPFFGPNGSRNVRTVAATANARDALWRGEYRCLLAGCCNVAADVPLSGNAQQTVTFSQTTSSTKDLIHAIWS